jgi:hypothetical protein
MYEEYMKAVNNLTINEENRLKLKVQLLESNKADYVKMYEKLSEKIDAKFDDVLARNFWKNNVKRGTTEEDARPLTDEEIDHEITWAKQKRAARRWKENQILSELNLDD